MKVWRVNVSIDFDMPVYAASEKDAEEIADRNFLEEFENGRSLNCITHAIELSQPYEFKGCIPWGEENDRTVDEILEPKKAQS